MAVLSVLWAFCEALLPEGRQRRMVRLTVSLLIMASILSALNALFDHALIPSWKDASVFEQGSGTQAAETLALRAVANETEGYLVRMANKAGYDAQGRAWLTAEGALHHAELLLSPRGGAEPLFSLEELRARLALALQIDESRLSLRLSAGGGS